ncbi:hypothetical protein GOBAR_AA28955 [Gossypium barbadense]|uniref:PB1-like domain-containing protein n=1 Tax=Gossypium barbadense TaxID=3634 RepID=A0A2P5WKW6_GOSBA|nr:hypothetical protein GOBAR_AA28955 [Gossypium barbadense]
MSWDEEYYLILYVGGEVIRIKEDPNTISYFELCKIVKIELGFHTVMLIYFHEPSTVGLQNSLKVIYEDITIIAMLDFWVKFKEINLYLMGGGNVEGVQVDGKGDVKGVEIDDEGDVEGVQGDVEGVEGDEEGFEADEYGGEENGGQMSLGSTVGEYIDSGFGSSVGDEIANDFAMLVEVDNVAAAVNSKEHGNLVGSNEDEEHEDGERKRKKFPLYNDRSDSLKFSLRMLFKDRKLFKISKGCRRQLNFLKNESKWVAMKCIASPNCPWRILASTKKGSYVEEKLWFIGES